MGIKLFSVVMIVFIVMVSGCANSGDKWPKGVAQNSDNTESGWQKNQSSTDDLEKKASKSYWSEESRY